MPQARAVSSLTLNVILLLVLMWGSRSMLAPPTLQITSAEATVIGALATAAASVAALLLRWAFGRKSAEERNAQFWRDQVVPLTTRVTSLEDELTRVKEAFALEAHTNASRLQDVQIAHAQTLRAVQEKADADRRADATVADGHLREVTAQFRLELEGKDLEITALRQETVRLLAERSPDVRPQSGSVGAA